MRVRGQVLDGINNQLNQIIHKNIFSMQTIQLSIPTSLQRLIDLLENNPNLNPLKAKQLVLSANVQVEDMMVYADFDHPTEDNYGRKLVFDGGRFEVMVMSWNPGHYSSIHNHGYTDWGVVQVFGNTQNINFCIKNGELQIAKKEVLQPGEAIKVNNALIHQMGNPTSSPYLTLHVYGSNSLDTDVTADAQNFDLEHNRIAFTTGGAFFNLPDTDINRIAKGVRPSKAAFIHYSTLLLNYYNRQKNTPKIQTLKRNLLTQMREWSAC